MQGPPSGRGAGLSADEYKARSVQRAEAYKKTMDRMYGLSTPEAPRGNTEARRDDSKYCIIHDARSHSTEECVLLSEYHQKLGERQRQVRGHQGGSKSVNGQGN